MFYFFANFRKNIKKFEFTIKKYPLKLLYILGEIFSKNKKISAKGVKNTYLKCFTSRREKFFSK